MADYSFRDAAERAASVVEAPKPLPSGMWRFKIRGGKFKEITGRGDKAPVWEASYPLTAMEPIENVNEQELEMYGDYSDATNIFYSIPGWRKDDEWNVVRFHSETLQQEIDGLSLEDLPSSANGFEFCAEVSTEYVGEDHDRPVTRIKNATRIEF